MFARGVGVSGGGNPGVAPVGPGGRDPVAAPGVIVDK